MNCKPGDLAVFVSVFDDSLKENLGKLVEVIRPEGHGYWLCRALSPMACYRRGIDPAGSTGVCEDRGLRPIRDQPGEDETLSWASLPNKETV